MDLNINQVEACRIINHILAQDLPFAVPSGKKNMELRFSWSDWGGEITRGYAVTELASVDKNRSTHRKTADLDSRWQITPAEWEKMNREEEKRYRVLPDGDFRSAVIGFYGVNAMSAVKEEYYIGMRMEDGQVTGVVPYWNNRFDEMVRISTDYLDRTVSSIFPDVAECYPGSLLDDFDDFMQKVKTILSLNCKG